MQDVFFYMCFCVNNQFRIIVEGSTTGSDNLEEVFQTNLRRIGQVVAVLDTWEEPVYLQRVWTIYEQYVACSLQVPVTFVMPEDAAASGRYKMEKQLEQGSGLESKAPLVQIQIKSVVAIASFKEVCLILQSSQV